MTSMRLLVVIAFAWLGVVSAQYGAMELGEGLSPRFYLGTSPQLARRQSGICASDEHSCLDVNATVCCANSQYCIIDSDFSAKCCDIGSNCGNACPSSLYQCKTTTTISGKPTVTAACCPRSCPSVSSFKCASAFGGGCCPFGYACQSSNSCSPTAAATSSTNAPIVSEIPNGCTTSQIACPTTMGGGCCGIGLTCTVVDNTNYCASASGSATRTGPDGILASGITKTAKSSGLSSGAKAGIGAGVAVGALVVIGGLLWFCVAHRRQAMRSQHSSSAPAMSQAGESTGHQSRPSAGRHASDYFGPSAKAGPFTEDHTSPGTSPGVNRGGVPVAPHGPNDIATPVEIDSRDHSNVTSPGLIDEHLKKPGVSEYPFELP